MKFQRVSILSPGDRELSFVNVREAMVKKASQSSVPFPNITVFIYTQTLQEPNALLI